MDDNLFKMLVELPENRTAFIAALIMERCKRLPDGSGLLVPRFNAYQATRIAQNLISLAVRIHSFAETECNREVTPIEEARAMTTRTKFEEIARAIGLIPTCGGDPRGACAYLGDPSSPNDGDDMGGRGWGVYR